MHREPWTAEMDAFLRTIRNGHPMRVVAEMINEKFGTVFTKNAVIGRCGRLGLPKLQKGRWQNHERAPRQPRPHKNGARYRADPATDRRFKANNPSAGNHHVEIVTDHKTDWEIPLEQRIYSVVDLQRCHCRWGVGTPGTPQFFFCGAPEADFPFRAYCTQHQARSTSGGDNGGELIPLAPRKKNKDFWAAVVRQSNRRAA